MKLSVTMLWLWLLVASPMSLWLLWWPPTGSSMFMVVVMLLNCSVLHCLYSVGNKITTTTTTTKRIHVVNKKSMTYAVWMWRKKFIFPQPHSAKMVVYGMKYLLYFEKMTTWLQEVVFYSRVPFYQYGLTVIPAWITNHIPKKMWDEITYPFPNFEVAPLKKFRNA